MPRPLVSQTKLAVSVRSDFSRELQLAVEYCNPTDLRSYLRNSRTHSKRQIKQIADSIRAFGFVSPLLADQTGELIAGHGRLAAAKLLGLKTVPVLRIEHLSEPQKRALRLADNRLAELAGWDRDLLAIEFRDLLEIDLKLELDFDVAITGFASAEIDQLVDTVSDKTSDTVDDVLPIEDSSPSSISRVGDIWQLGEHCLLCGDARDPNLYPMLLGDELARAGIHDAPYNVSITKHVSRSGKHPEFAMGVGEMQQAEFTAFLSQFLRHASRHSQPGAIQWAFMDWRHSYEMLEAGRQANLELKNIAVWNKGVGGMGSLLRSQHELVFMFKEPNGAHINNVELGKFGRNRTNVWDYPGAAGLHDELQLHPTPKPVALVADAIRDVSNRNDIVLDVFCGSGTTIIAAAKTGRRARCIEIDPHYVDVAIRRWETWSGGCAFHTGTGLTFADLGQQRSVGASAPFTRRDGKPVITEARKRTRPTFAKAGEIQ